MKRVFRKFNFILLLMSTLSGCFKGSYDGASTGVDNPDYTLFVGAESAETINGTTTQVNWKLPTDPSLLEFNVFSIDISGTLRMIGTTPSTVNYFRHTGLTPGRLQRYVVRAVRNNGVIDINRKTVSALPYAGISSAHVINETTVDLFFPSAADATNLRIYCAVGMDGSMTLRQQVNGATTSVRLTNLQTATVHACKVKAVLSDGSEDQNTVVRSFTPDVVTDPFGFDGLASAINPNGTSVNLSWVLATPEAGKTISSYRIFLNIGENLDFYDAPAGASDYTVRNLTPGNNYRFMVRAIDSNGANDGNLVWKTAFTYAGISSVTVSSSTQATLFFPPAPNALSLKVYCYKVGDPVPTVALATLQGTASSHVLTNSFLEENTTYRCSVKAVGTGGEDGNEAFSEFTTAIGG